MKLHFPRIALLGLCVIGLAATKVNAQIVPVFVDETAADPGTGTHDYKFTGISLTNYPNYPTLSANLGAWPAPIYSNGGNTAEQFNKVVAGDSSDFLSNGQGGGIYSFMSRPKYSVSNLATIDPDIFKLTFQLYIATGSDADPSVTGNLFVGLPTVTLTLANNTTQTITAGPGTLLNTTTAMVFGPTTLSDYGFTFDLSSVGQPIKSYTINYQTANHTIVYGIDVTEAAVPEPSTYAMLAIGGACLGLYRWRSRRTRTA